MTEEGNRYKIILLPTDNKIDNNLVFVVHKC